MPTCPTFPPVSSSTRLSQSCASYNLEKPPLQTDPAPADGRVRTRVMSAVNDYFRGRLAAGGFLLELIVLTVGFGLVGLWLAVGMVEQYFASFWL